MEQAQGLKRKVHEELNAMGSIQHGSHANKKRLPQGGRASHSRKRNLNIQDKPSKKAVPYQWKGENHMPALLARLPTLAKQFPQLTGRPPEEVV